ncbi:MAG: transcription antitermination factor NusB [Ignavibacteria bacterium]|nr:transcription antitermination factor NusB [Ignavibacteria bacterium]
MPQTRRHIRIKVMQILYAQSMNGDPIEMVMRDLLSDVEDKENKQFAEDLIHYILDNLSTIEEIVDKKVENWEAERMAYLDKVILKIGVAELLNFPEIPPKVTINEAIEIAKDFSSKSSGKFVNGVLDAILEDLKKEDKLNKTGRGLLNLEKKGGAKK